MLLSDRRVEAVADDFGGVCDGDEGVRFVGSDEIAEPDGLRAPHDGDDDGFVLFFVVSHRVVCSRAAVQGMDDVFTDGIRVVTDDGEYLAEVDVFDHAVDDEGFREQAAHGEQSRFRAEDEERRDRDRHIGKHEGGADVDARIFRKDHGNDVGTTAGRVVVKEDGGRNGGHDDGENQLQKRLGGQRLVHGIDDLGETERAGQQQRDVDGLDPESAAKHRKPEHQQRDVENERQG